MSAATSQKGLLLLPVNLFRREQLAFCGLEGFAFVFYGTEETGLVALVTCGAVLLDLDQQRVAIAIERDVFHDLCVTAFLALHPELLS